MDLPTAKDPYEDLDSTDAPGVARHGRPDDLSAKHPQGDRGSDRLAHVYGTGPDSLSDLRQAVRQVAAAALLASIGRRRGRGMRRQWLWPADWSGLGG